MHFTKKSSSEKRIELKNKLKKQKILKFPGAYNPLTAKLITEIGFEGIYISGAVIANDLGIPDIGLTTLKEVSYRANQISRVSDLPAIIDVDTGFGNCKKTIETFEKLGLSGCHIEDQIDEKRCGHLDNKEIIPLDKMVNKIKTAVNAKKDKNFLIIARTDANSVEGIKKTIDRAKAYEDAGADIIFPEAMKDEKEFELIRKNLKVSLLANMTEFEQYLWIDCDAWVNSWEAVELYFQACENGKLGITQTIGAGYKVLTRVQWVIGKLALIKSQNYKHAKKSGFTESTARKIAFAPHLNIGVFSLEKNSKCWKLWQEILNKALSSGGIFGSEGLAINIAVYDRDTEVEFLPLSCNWIASNVLPKYDEKNQTFVEPYLPHKKIGIMHLAAGIWKDNKDMRVDKNVKISIQTVQGSKLQKSLRYGH